MQEEYTRLVDRLAQTLYVVGAIAASLPAIAAITQWSQGQHSFAVLILLVALLFYGAGWAIRWVISGRRTTLLSYFAPLLTYITPKN